jgi:hypothetical protein
MKNLPTIPRQPAELYMILFSWVDPETNEICYPSIEETKKTLEGLGKKNEGLARLRGDLETLKCGKRWTTKKRKRAGGTEEQYKAGDTNWTYTDYHYVFELMKDTIPVNPSWENTNAEGSVQWLLWWHSERFAWGFESSFQRMSEG